MQKFNYLNIGCGSKFHPAWVNIDMKSNHPRVQSCNVLDGLPFAEGKFDAIYHSHVLEHLPRNEAPGFTRECFRVLKPGGTLRVVVPDLENIAREYLLQLEENIRNPGNRAEANYDWMMLELYDQTVRNHNGGEMGEFLRHPRMINEDYVIDRIGFVGRSIREQVAARAGRQAAKPGLRTRARHAAASIKNHFKSRARRIGEFRLGGEVHLWMYDRFSLARLLTSVGFVSIVNLTPGESSIPDWNSFELDVRNGKVFDPTSLFMEATKPG